MRGVRAAVAAVLIAASWPGSANAACMSAWVTFSEIAPSADRVVIGTVADAVADEPDGNGYASVFKVSVEEALRGPDAAVVEIHDAVNNPVCGTTVLARNGDRIALAIGGSALGSNDVTALAYLTGVPYRFDIEVMSRDDAYAAAEIELPKPTTPPIWLGWLLLGIAAAVVVVLVRLRRTGVRLSG